MLDTPTLALILTAAGATIGAGLVTGLIELLKRTIPVIGTRSWEPALAFISSAVLVILAFVDQHDYTLEAGFAAFIAWLAVAKLATGIHDEITSAPGAIFNPPATG